MAKIVRIKTPQDNIVEAIEYLLQKAKDGDLTNFVFAGMTTDGNIATSWANADVGERNELTAHLQIDIMYSVMKANMDQLVEYV